MFTGPCNANVNHAVAIVGYGGAGSADYWLLKNSWGTSWGEGGYMRLTRTVPTDEPEGVCGILLAGSYPEHTK